MATIKIYSKPQNLYRYRPLGNKLNQEIDAIRMGYIYCPLFSEMNDPMEGSYRISRFINENSSNTEVRNEIKTTGIASLSEVRDHEPMWAHYAEQFGGICIQYNVNDLLEGLDSDVEITRMSYSEIAPTLESDTNDILDKARHCLSNKTIRWASEREWRIFKKERGEARYKNINTIKKIFLGPRISEESQEKIISLGQELRINILKMELQSYNMKFNSIYIPPKKVLIRKASKH